MSASPGRGARNKGAAGERELAKLITAESKRLGLPLTVLRGHGQSAPRAGRIAQSADCHGLPEHHIETKRQERIEIEKWCRQAEADAGELVPLVVWRRSRQPWRVTLPLSCYLALLARVWRATEEGHVAFAAEDYRPRVERVQ